MANRTEKDLWIEMSIREIWTQARFAEIAYSNIDSKATKGTDAVFSSVHSFLSHCAMISKMLQAKEDGDLGERYIISDVLGILSTSVIHKRKFRNNLEHYDSELKKWIWREDALNRTIGTYNIGPKASYQIPNMLYVSHYDQITKIFTFVNKDFNLKELFDESQRIMTITDQWIKNMEVQKITPPFI
jgi:hypothetical protein